MSEKDRARYFAAAHAVQSGVAADLGYDHTSATPKHLRVGINITMSDLGSLAKLMIAKGVITLDEYEAALADGVEEEKARYEALLTARLGNPVTLA